MIIRRTFLPEGAIASAYCAAPGNGVRHDIYAMLLQYFCSIPWISMTRLPRYVNPGQPQHIIQRGNNRQVIFAADADYQFFRDTLAGAAKKHVLAIHAYVRMGRAWGPVLTFKRHVEPDYLRLANTKLVSWPIVIATENPRRRNHALRLRL